MPATIDTDSIRSTLRKALTALSRGRQVVDRVLVVPELEAVRKEILWALRDLGESRAESELMSGLAGLGTATRRPCARPWGLKYEDNGVWKKVTRSRFKTKAAADEEAYRAEYSTGHGVKSYRVCGRK
jgi:hypothetical protein